MAGAGCEVVRVFFLAPGPGCLVVASGCFDYPVARAVAVPVPGLLEAIELPLNPPPLSIASKPYHVIIAVPFPTRLCVESSDRGPSASVLHDQQPGP